MQITAGNGEKVNTMTASWGGMGVIWDEDVVYIFVRQTRYTKEFIDGSDYFSLGFFDEEYRKKLAYLGKTSGRDEDKISKVGFHVVKTDEEQPTFEEGKMVFVCKKLMETQLNPEEFIDSEVDGRWYPQKDYHHMYTAEVIAAYRIEQ